MDPLTAISLASNIVSFIDFGVQVVSGAIEVHGAFSGDSPGLTEENRSTRSVVTEMRHLASKLQPPNSDQLTRDEKAICALAKECQSLSDQIIALIEKVRPQGTKSKRSSLTAAMKTRWYEKDRQRLEDRLGHCQTQLGLHLNYLTSSEVKTRLDAIINSAKADDYMLELLYSQIEDCRRGVLVSSLSIAAQSQIRDILDIPDHASDKIVQERILTNLSFPDMHQRYDQVPEAHSMTLRWIFEERPTDSLGGCSGSYRKVRFATPIDHAKVAARQALLTWLSSEKGIFHISGKFGSGKSTLMKFLWDHRSTRTMLQSWAGPHKLVCANFFFWRPGSVFQKSLTGLYRSLLYSILEAVPGLIPVAVPEVWKEAKSTTWQTMSNIRFSERDIRRAFSLLISNPSLYKNHRICFFIDGLDEYEETLQDDAKSLVELLCSWTTSAPGNVKLCVSSREYNVFMNAFSASQRIRLHEVTRTDMEHYVSIKLSSMEEERGRAELTEAVVHKSRGIFLWVALVVKRLREQIENGHNLASLKREVDALPKEIEELLAHLLDSLPKADLKEAYQIFSMVMQLNEDPEAFFSVVSYSFLEEYNLNRTFALDEDFTYVRLKPADLDARRKSALKRLNGCCKGLVEEVLLKYTDIDTGENTDDYAIVFTHRCVSEFLSTDVRQNHIRHLLPDFNSVDALSHLVLAELLADPQLVKRQGFRDSLLWLTTHRIGSNLDHAPYLLIEAFCEALSRPLNTVTGSSLTDVGWWIVYLPIPPAECGVYSLAYCYEDSHLRCSRYGVFPHPIYQAAWLGNNEYVKWKLTHNVTTCSQFNMEVVLHSMVSTYAHSEIDDVIDIVGILIDRGLMPNAPTTVRHVNLDDFAILLQRRESFKKRMRIDVTIWQHLLLSCFPRAETRSPNGPFLICGYIVETFLEHGADPYFELDIEKVGDKRFIFKLVLGKEQRRVSLVTDTCSVAPFKATSLVEYIKFCGFENEVKILSLIERNLARDLTACSLPLR